MAGIEPASEVQTITTTTSLVIVLFLLFIRATTRSIKNYLIKIRFNY